MKDRVVIYRLGSLGDTIAALPCFNLIARAFPDAERIALTNFPVSSRAAPLEAILKDGGLIHDAVAYPQKVRDPYALFRLASSLRRLEASTLVYLAAGRGLARIYRDVLFFRLCGFRNIVGAPLTSDLARNRIDPNTGFEERESSRLARTLAVLGQIDLEDPSFWDLHLTEFELKMGDNVLEAIHGHPFIVANMGGKAAEKDWGEDNWRALFDILKPIHPEFGLVIVGADDESWRADRASLYWSGLTLNLCGKVSPRECAVVMRRASLFVGHDSGPLHLAACVAIPCVGIFGNYNRPLKWHPYGRKNHILHNMSGTRAIQPADVAAAILDFVRD